MAPVSVAKTASVEIAVETFNGVPQVHLRALRSGRTFSFSIVDASDVAAGIQKAVDHVVASARAER